MKRRTLLALPLLVASAGGRSAEPHVAYPAVEAGVGLKFPRDHGSHPRFRTEWWYVTGHLDDPSGRTIGLQITFFRSRPGIAEGIRSEFAPVQIVFAHAALAIPSHGRLMHDQRAARTGFGLADASEDTTDVHIENWSFALRDGFYHTRIAAREFDIDASFRPSAPPLLQGDAGVSRKGPLHGQASYYYSIPQLTVRGRVTMQGRTTPIEGIAWLDHEWSSEYLSEGARGWDWTGINLNDGGALMAFRIRDRDGNTYWSAGSHRDAAGRVTLFGREEIRFEALRQWRSPRTNVQYPVAMRVHAGSMSLTLDPLMDDQELDARSSVGTVYWEGAVHAVRENDGPVGRGYLELTGYGRPLRL